MGEDAPQLVPGQDVEDASGHGDGGMVRVPAGSEGVRLHVGGDVELRHRHPRCLGELADHPVVLRHLLLGDGDGPSRTDGQLVGEPVGPSHQGQAQCSTDEQAALSEQRAHEDEEAADEGQQHIRLDGVLAHPILLMSPSTTPSRHRAFRVGGAGRVTRRRHRSGTAS